MIDPTESALLIIDMQNGFIDPTSALCIPGAAQTLPALAQALKQARRLGLTVIHVLRSYAQDGSDVEACRHRTWLLSDRPLSSACSDPHSAEEPSCLTPLPGERIIIKQRFSAFFATELDMVLRRLGVKNIVLSGTTTPNCIRATCFDALSLDYNVVVLHDCTSSRTPAVQSANIEDMNHIGAFIMSSEDFCTKGLSQVPDLRSQVYAACR